MPQVEGKSLCAVVLRSRSQPRRHVPTRHEASDLKARIYRLGSSLGLIGKVRFSFVTVAALEVKFPNKGLHYRNEEKER